MQSDRKVRTISEWVLLCNTAMNGQLATLEAASAVPGASFEVPALLEDQFGKFDIWCATTAMLIPDSPPERHRARGQHVWSLVERLLCTLESHVKKLSLQISGPILEMTPGQDAESLPVSRLVPQQQQQLMTISNDVNMLFKLSDVVKEINAEQTKSIIHWGEISPDFDLSRDSNAFEHALRLVERECPTAGFVVTDRIATAMILRSRQMTITSEQDIESAATVKWRSTSRQSVLDLVKIHRIDTALIVRESLTEIDMRDLLQNGYPPLPVHENKHRACPYCTDQLTRDEAENIQAWQNHVKNDLKAYLCLDESCVDLDKLYVHSEDWLEHVRQNHCLAWRCRARSHKPLTFQSCALFEDHIRQQHGASISDARMKLLADKSATPRRIIFSDCPLCGSSDTDSDMEAHVGKHLRRLALRSLLWQDNNGAKLSLGETTTGKSRPLLGKSTVDDTTDIITSNSNTGSQEEEEVMSIGTSRRHSASSASVFDRRFGTSSRSSQRSAPSEVAYLTRGKDSQIANAAKLRKPVVIHNQARPTYDDPRTRYSGGGSWY